MVRKATIRERLLDAAAYRFATDGVGATSIRAVIGDAGANLNSVHYHFGSKGGLVLATWNRVIEPIMSERREALARLADPADVEEVLDALYGPILKRASFPHSQGARALLVLQQIRHDPSEEARAVLRSHEDDLAPAFNEALARSLDCSTEDIELIIGLVNGAVWDHAAQAVLGPMIGSDSPLDGDHITNVIASWLRAATNRGRDLP